MFISITSSQGTPDKFEQVENFLRSFLPRMRQFPGVVAIYHYARPEKMDESTIVIWESEEALKKYRQSELVQEAIAFEKKMAMPGTREAYPITFML